MFKKIVNVFKKKTRCSFLLDNTNFKMVKKKIKLKKIQHCDLLFDNTKFEMDLHG